MDRERNRRGEILGDAKRWKRCLRQVCLLMLSAVLMSGCGQSGYSKYPASGGSSSGSGSGGDTGPGTTTTTTPGEAQGVYTGTDPVGFTHYAIVLPNDMYYSFYGFDAADGSTFEMWGMMSGQGRSDNGKYTVGSLTDFTMSGPVAKTLTATYVPGTTLTAAILVLRNDATYNINGTALPSSMFNYKQPANLSPITGAWTTGGGTMIISSDGTFTGVDGGCTFSGRITPDGSSNFFNLAISNGDAPCVPPNQTASGVAVEHLLANGVTQQLLGGGAITGGDWVLTFAARR